MDPRFDSFDRFDEFATPQTDSKGFVAKLMQVLLPLALLSLIAYGIWYFLIRDKTDSTPDPAPEDTPEPAPPTPAELQKMMQAQAKQPGGPWAPLPDDPAMKAVGIVSGPRGTAAVAQGGQCSSANTRAAVMTTAGSSGQPFIMASNTNPAATPMAAARSGQYNLAAPSDVAKGIKVVPQGYNPIGVQTGIVPKDVGVYNAQMVPGMGTTTNAMSSASNLMPSTWSNNAPLTAEQRAQGLSTQSQHAARVRASASARGARWTRSPTARTLGMPNLLRSNPAVPINPNAEHFNDSPYRLDIIHAATGKLPGQEGCC